MRSFPKHGSLRCPEYLAFVRRQACQWCDRESPVEAHHWPLKARGYTDDTATCALCRRCHRRAHETGKYDSNMSHASLDQLVAAMWFRFRSKATPEEWEAVSEARATWYASQVFHEKVTP